MLVSLHAVPPLPRLLISSVGLVLAAAILISKVSSLAPLVAPLPRDLPDSEESVVPLEMMEPSELSLRLDMVELTLCASLCLRGMLEGLRRKRKIRHDEEKLFKKHYGQKFAYNDYLW